MTNETVTSNDVLSNGEFISTTNSSTIEKITASNIRFNGVEFKAEWVTEGLKIPMVLNNGDGNHPYYFLITREEIVKMFKDINEEFSHT